tara:strand:- start:2683 stop:4446 length:1764 start_codon:yes stop_codon:yes gene_type:complete
MLRTLQSLLLVFVLLFLHGNLSHSYAQDAASIEAAQMLERGDSLLELGKPVAALSMFRGAEERSFDPCLIARARMGIAEVHAESHNPDQASSALILAGSGLLACSASDRLELTLLAADLWLSLQREEQASAVLRRELQMQPEHILLHSRMAQIAFIAGDWTRAREALDFCLNRPQEALSDEQMAEWLSYLVQLDIIENRNPNDSIVTAFQSISITIPLELAQDYRKQIYGLLALKNHHLAYEWAQLILEFTPRNQLNSLALAHLRLATAAHRANRPLDAVIGFHEAIKAARATTDLVLLADALRQKAEFEMDRSNFHVALSSMFEVDSIKSALLWGLRSSDSRQVRGFTEQLLPEPDPFERAVADLADQRAQRPDLGAWPWLAAILAIGLLSMNRSHRRVKSALKKERRRLIRLRSLVPSDRLSQDDETVTEEDESLSNSSLMPNGAFVYMRDDNPSAQSIQAFMSELDEDIQSTIAWDSGRDLQFTIGPDVRIALRNLIRGFIELSHDQQDVQVQIEQLGAHWKFSISSDHTEASKALRGLFYGKDALASSRWNELHAQLRKLAGKIQVERISPVREKLSVILPST